MRCKIHSLSTGLSSITSICLSRRSSIARLSGGAGLSRAGRHSRTALSQELVYRNTRPLVQPVQPPAPRIIQNTVHQTVVHLHQTTHQHILNRLSAARDGQGNTMLLVKQTAMQPASASAIDDSRPALAARRMLRVLSTESARQTLRPFYRNVLQELLERERDEYRNKPAQSLLLVQSMLGRHQTLTTLRRFYRRTTEQLDSSVFHSLIYRKYIRHIQQDGEGGFVHRYVNRELSVPEDLRLLPVAKRLPPPPPPEHETVREPQTALPKPSPPPAYGLRLSNNDFQMLVRGVADVLGRQSRLNSLRRGGSGRTADFALFHGV